ncbi:MAG: succinyl-diaminopimelate desuccinylase [Acidimicrobiia bacterium]
MNLVETLTWLVDTSSETGDEGRLCTEIAARLYQTFGRESVDRVGNSLVVGPRDSEAPILLVGHIDTVPSQGQSPSYIDDGRLHGLGATDMKSGVAVMLHLLEDREVRLRDRDLIGVFYAGEEGPADGNELESVLTRAPWLSHAEFAIVLEPSDAEVQIGCNGRLNARVAFDGVSAHSARPWLGKNAITKAGSWLAAMHDLEPEPVEIDGLIYREVISVTRAEGGIANNIIPDRFELNVNYRFAPNRSIEEATDRLRQVCDGVDEFVIADAAPAGPIDINHPILDRLLSVSAAPRAAKQGWTDVARLGAYGIPAVNYGPGETGLAHKKEESVRLDDLELVFSNLRTVLLDAESPSELAGAW